MIPLRDDNPTARKPVITIALIVLNVLMFYVEYQAGFEFMVYRLGAIPGNILQGRDWFTLVTSMFLHGGLWHLAGNMLYLWIFADNVENIMGRPRFIAFYFLCGLIAAATHILMSGPSEVPMVGASGAISGVLGAYVVRFPRAKVLVIIPVFWFLMFREIPALFVLGFWFVMQLFSGVLVVGMPQTGGGVAFWAHIGGFLAGMVLVFFFHKPQRPRVVWP